MRKSPAPDARSREITVRSIDLERDVLHHLCHARLTRPAWAEVARELHEYAWRDVEHELVFTAIERLGFCDSQTLREQLPAQATRMGFPDINWQAYFSPEGKRSPAPSASRVMRQIERLMAPRTPSKRRGRARARQRHPA